MSAADVSRRKTPVVPSLASSGTGWIIRRALLAVALMVGFYVFALTIALALLWIPFAEWRYLGRLDVRPAAVAIGAGLTILWSIIPRADQFQAPGPQLSASTHPELFKVITQVATATQQEPPVDVYLLNEVNAWVSQRGGTMGFGSRRVMGIGLPLLQAVSIPEFKGIIAHEFGHYASGDVKLGPWVYKTRAAIVRTVIGLHKTIVQAPFRWYANLFLRLTHGVSRRQEFIADQVAAGVVGAPTVANALRRITAAGRLFSTYLNDDVLPLLRAGFAPPIASGFDEFLQAELVGAASQQILAAEETEGQTNRFDTHPSLRDRLAALAARTGTAEQTEPGAPASTLLSNLDQEALGLVRFAVGSETVARLKSASWDEAGRVYGSRFREISTANARWLSGFVADALPGGNKAFIQLGSNLVAPNEQNVNSDIRIARAAYLLGVGIGVLLLDDGWLPSTGPGKPVVMMRGSEMFEPLTAVRELANGVISSDEWRARCHALGIAGKPLGNAVGVQAMSTRQPPPFIANVNPSVARSTMVNEINCWRCKQAIPVEPTNRGKKVACPQCGTKQRLPM